MQKLLKLKIPISIIKQTVFNTNCNKRDISYHETLNKRALFLGALNIKNRKIFPLSHLALFIC